MKKSNSSNDKREKLLNQFKKEQNVYALKDNNDKIQKDHEKYKMSKVISFDINSTLLDDSQL